MGTSPRAGPFSRAPDSWADTARYGLVRRCVAPMNGWLATYNMYPSPAVYPHYYGDAPALEAAWVADPQGVQLFTDAHLQRINLDSSWTVEPVTTGKHLVKARDLGQWFDLGRPLDSTLTEARNQFSSILVTDDIALHAWETPRPPRTRTSLAKPLAAPASSPGLVPYRSD